MKKIIILLVFWSFLASVHAAPVRWNIEFQNEYSDTNPNAGNGFFTYDPETEDTVTWFTFGGYDPVSGPYGIEQSIKVNTLVTFDMTILGGRFTNGSASFPNEYGAHWWLDDIGDVHHGPGAIRETAGHPPGFSNGKGFSESRDESWGFGDGHFGLYIGFGDDINASNASGYWLSYSSPGAGTWTATRVNAVPIPGAIPLFSSGLLGLIWFRKKIKRSE